MKRKRQNSDWELYEKDPQRIINILVGLEKTVWTIQNPKLKLSQLLKDPAMENIMSIPHQAYQLAEKRMVYKFPSGNGILPPIIEEQEAQSNIEQLDYYLEQVREFNENSALYYVSEGKMDYLFAAGITKNMSLRIGRAQI